jgi:hypothetical protein
MPIEKKEELLRLCIKILKVLYPLLVVILISYAISLMWTMYLLCSSGFMSMFGK